jgi:hypothetical protein
MSDMVLLRTSEDMNSFLRKFKPILKNKIEYEVLGNYSKNKILIIAEHAETKKLFLPEYGSKAFIGIGDKNTDKLAKLASHRIRCAYIIPRILRTQVDLSRSYKEFREASLSAGLFNAEGDRKARIPIHMDIDKASILFFFHNKIEDLNPKAILSFHGMHPRYKPDIILGFGPKRKYFDRPFEFREFLQTRLKDAFSSLGLENGLDIKISKNLFTGTKNYTLYKHVKEFNENSRKKRLGIHVEFNLRGRLTKTTKELPKLRYQVAAQVLAECLEEWLRKRN